LASFFAVKLDTIAKKKNVSRLVPAFFVGRISTRRNVMGYWGTELLQSDTALDAIDYAVELKTTELHQWFESRLHCNDPEWAVEVLAVAKYLVDQKFWNLKDFGTTLLHVIVPAFMFEMANLHNWGNNSLERFRALVTFYTVLMETADVAVAEEQVG